MPDRTTPAQEAGIAFAVALVTYLLTFSWDVGLDDCFFAMSVDALLQGQGAWWTFFHPHHPFLNPIVASLTWIGRSFDPRLLVLDVGAGVSAVFGAAAVGGLVLLLRRRGIGSVPALLAGGALMTCGGFWAYSTRFEVYSMTAAMVVLWLAAASAEPPRPVATGLALAGAILSHVAAGVLLLPTLWRFRRQPRALVVSAVAGLGGAVAVLYPVLGAAHGAWSPASWIRLILLDGSAGRWVHLGVGAFGSALHRLLVSDWYHRVPVLVEGASVSLDALAMIATAIAAVLLVTGLVGAARRADRLPRLAAGACLAFAPIWLLWDVGNLEHLLAPAPLLAVLLATGAVRLRTAGSALLATLLALLVLVNGVGMAVPQSRKENSRAWVLASFVQQSTPEDALIVTAGTDSLFRGAVAYLAGRRFADLRLLESRLPAGEEPALALAAWCRQAEASPELWAHPDVFSATGRALVAEMKLSPAAWEEVVSRMEPLRSVTLPADGAVVQEDFTLTRVRFRQE